MSTTTLRTTAILKTDLAGSTPRFRELPETDLADLLREHRALLTRIAAAHDGRMWRVWEATLPVLDADVRGLYGEPFEPALTRPPTSAPIAEGSPVIVYPPARLPRGARVGVA